MTYNALGQLRQRTLGNGAVTTYDYYGAAGPASPASFCLYRNQTVKGATLFDMTYTYDGDGHRVKETDAGGNVTVMIGGTWYEKNITTGVETVYYYAGEQRIALRTVPGEVYYLLTDHLGSTAVTLNGDGTTKVGELRYGPYGGVRYTWGATPTDYRFTGQRLEPNLALADFGARFYEPMAGRFVQPDTIVPEPGNPQVLNP